MVLPFLFAFILKTGLNINMRLHRFIGDFDLNSGTIETIDSELINQLKNVFRLKTGDRVILVDGQGQEAEAEIKSLHKDNLELVVDVSTIRENKNEPERQVTLYCAVLKKEHFELVVEKATEVGVRIIVPIITERTVKTGLRLDRLEKIIKEAAEQSGRGRVPSVGEPINLAEAIKQAASQNQVNYFLHTKVIEHSVLDKKEIEQIDKVGLFVGPEGGWTEGEVVAAEQVGCQLISLGSLTLRAETAAIVGSYLSLHGLD